MKVLSLMKIEEDIKRSFKKEDFKNKRLILFPLNDNMNITTPGGGNHWYY